MNYCQFRNDVIKRMANAGGGILPAEYQQVEWLQSTGTQYINTAINNTGFTEYLCRLNIQSYNSTNYIFGTWGDNARCFISYNNGPAITWLGYSNGYASTAALPTSTDITLSGILRQGQQTLNINGTRVITLAVSSQITPIMQMYLYGVNWQNESNARYIIKAKMYGFTLHNNSSTILDYIPCYRKADNKPGMYDLVTNTFFTNAGTGEFTVGQDV